LEQGQDDRNVWHGEALLPPRCPPPLGGLTGARGATPVAPGVGGSVRLTAVSTRPQLSAHGLGPAVEPIIHHAARAGPASRATPLLSGGTIVPADVCHRWPSVPQRGERAAMRAVLGACTTSKVWLVRCASRAVVLGRLGPRRAWRMRHAPPRAQRGGAEAWRRVCPEASVARPRWRTTRGQVVWRVVAGRGVCWGRAGNPQGRGRARGQ
jgi:hypothetical protein